MTISGVSVQEAENLCRQLVEELHGWGVRELDTTPFVLRHPALNGGPGGVLRVYVSSSPGGASITIDGKDNGTSFFADAVRQAAAPKQVDEGVDEDAHRTHGESGQAVDGGQRVRTANTATGWEPDPDDPVWG
ncbi:MAG: hypothetical protein WCO96_03320, partial [Actinomycetes bacterium]